MTPEACDWLLPILVPLLLEDSFFDIHFSHAPPIVILTGYSFTSLGGIPSIHSLGIMGHPFASPVPSAHPATLDMPAVSLTVSDVMLRSETVPMYRTNAWWAYTKYKGT